MLLLTTDNWQLTTDTIQRFSCFLLQLFRNKVLKNKVHKLNKKIKENIEGMENDIETAQAIVKVIGYFDDAIKIAADLVL